MDEPTRLDSHSVITEGSGWWLKGSGRAHREWLSPNSHAMVAERQWRAHHEWLKSEFPRHWSSYQSQLFLLSSYLHYIVLIAHPCSALFLSGRVT